MSGYMMNSGPLQMRIEAARRVAKTEIYLPELQQEAAAAKAEIATLQAKRTKMLAELREAEAKLAAAIEVRTAVAKEIQNLKFEISAFGKLLMRERDAYQTTIGPRNDKRKGSIIVRRICRMHRLSYEELTSGNRAAPVARARHHAAWLMARQTKLSLPQIANFLGMKDHTSALHAINKISAERGEDCRYCSAERAKIRQARIRSNNSDAVMRFERRSAEASQ